MQQDGFSDSMFHSHLPTVVRRLSTTLWWVFFGVKRVARTGRSIKIDNRCSETVLLVMEDTTGPLYSALGVDHATRDALAYSTYVMLNCPL